MDNQRHILSACGEALYGSQWRTPLMQALGRDERLFRRWLAETVAVPPITWMTLARLLEQRQEEVAKCRTLLPTLIIKGNGEG